MPHLLIEDDGAVRILTLNRPEKKNAFNEALALELTDALHAAATDESVNVVLVTAAGDVFSAGADVNVFVEIGRTGVNPPGLAALQKPIRSFPKPLIAAVQGAAVGMGVTLLPHFDMVYASTKATFSTPFARLGVVVEYGSSYTLPRLIGRQRANEMVLRANGIDAATALDWGLVTRVFEDADFRDAVLAEAHDMAALPTKAVQASKKLIQQGEQSALSEALTRETEVGSHHYGSEENVKAVEAFLSKSARRRPS